MNETDFDDETLMAFADGALDPDEAQRVAEMAARDPDLASRIEVFRRTGALLGALGNAQPPEPIPQSLADRVAEQIAAARTDAPVAQAAPHTVVPFRARTRRSGNVAMALAASVALAVGVLGGIVGSRGFGTGSASDTGFAALNDAGVAQALGRLPSGERVRTEAGEIAVIASFMTDDGAFCREFELDTADSMTLVSVACQTDGQWQSRFAVASVSDDATYAPVSSLETLDTFLSAIGAGAPMAPAEEAAMLIDTPD